MVEVHTYSRKAIENCKNFADLQNNRVGLISIIDNDREGLSNHHDFAHVLELRFWDIDEPDSHHPEEEIFTDTQAQAILDFVEKVKDDIDILAIHCTAGLSRSTGAGEALAYIYQLPIWHMNGDSMIIPNRRVKRMLLRAANCMPKFD